MSSSTRQSALTIGDLAMQANCKVQTIRYYEQIGLMPSVRRSAGNQRLYNAGHAARLAFIRHSRALGFPLTAIRELLSLVDQPNQPCETADDIAQRQLAAVEGRLAQLASLKTELERMIVQCQGGRIADCRVIEVLADHHRCLSDHKRASV